MAQTYNGTLTGIQSIQVSEKAPLDVRTVVDYLSDLTTKWDGVEGHPGIQNLYTGIVVYVKETQEIYVLTSTPKNSDKPESWKKVGDTEGLASEEWVESQGYLKAADLPDFLTDSDLDGYVKVEDLDGYLKPEDIADLAKKSDLDGYVKVSDAAEFLTASDLDIYAKKSDLDDYLKVDELPVNVSDFVNDAGYLTESDLPDFLQDSDLDGYVKVEDLAPYLKAEDIADLAKKSDLDGYVKLEDAAEFLTASDLDDFAKKSDLEDYLRVDELPTNVSEFINDAGYLTESDLPDFLLASDLEDYVRIEELENYIPKSELEKLAKKSDLDGYVKTADALEFLTTDDLDGYAKTEDIPTKVSELANDEGYLKTTDLPDFLLASDLEDYVKVEDLENYIPKSELEELARKSDLDGYVRTEDALEFLTASDLNDYLKVSELPTNVSEFINDAGYLTESDLPDFLLASDLEDYVRIEELENYIPKSELEKLALKSDLDGYVKTADAIYFLTGDDLADYATKTDVDNAVTAGIESVISSNGSAPTSGTGFAISNNSPYVEEVYADDYLHAGVYYTSKGINSSKDNGGSELENVSSITLSNGGSSWIKLSHSGVIRINIEDDTLGFNLENIVGIDDDGTEHQNPYAGHPYSPSPIILSLADGCFLKFDKDIDFTGFTETRDDDPTEYVFGSTGSTFSDLDFYSINALPSVYAYADGTSVAVLTEGDKDEILNKIEESYPQSISTSEILGLF